MRSSLMSVGDVPRDDPRVIAALEAYLRASEPGIPGHGTSSWPCIRRSPSHWDSVCRGWSSSRRPSRSLQMLSSLWPISTMRFHPALNWVSIESSARSAWGYGRRL